MVPLLHRHLASQHRGPRCHRELPYEPARRLPAKNQHDLVLRLHLTPLMPRLAHPRPALRRAQALAYPIHQIAV
ncbi:hypothetical protein MINTM019_53320 [Mycobacterium paraintracellulare]|nr:hypothetical protein MINTM011_50240 [Mycobacterium paraintracellulare]BCP07876.1 hypothetical protein MINTM019_53320 [Mycobacterium paraintracellulare]BCP13064.1 hypothetical protein MINTM020_51620 [Mycobacterium paraintracellulare]